MSGMTGWERERQELNAYCERIRGRALALEEELNAALNSADVVGALIRARRAVEVVVIELCERELKRPRGSEPLASLLPRLKERLPESITVAIRSVIELGNLGAHPKPASRQEVRQAFVALVAILDWYIVDYNKGFGEPLAAQPDAPSRPPGPNPYLGLDSFQEKDAGRFFGREELLERDLWPAFQSLIAGPPRLLAMIGPSGCGKSSVARAGLLPRITAELPCRPVTLVPTHRPLDALAQVLARVALPNDPAPAGKAREFRDLLAADGQGLTRVAALLWEQTRTPLIVLLDQAEEVFSLCRDSTEPDRFLDNLLTAVTDPAPHLCVLLTLRSDFLGETQRFPAFNTLLTRQARFIPVPDEAGLHRAIAEPARLAGHPLAEAVVQLMLEQCRGQDGVLPLLQYALTEVWRGLQAGRPGEETLRAVGGVGGALAGRAQQVYESLPPAERVLARRCLPRLVQLGEGGPDTRRRVALEDLSAEGESPVALLGTLRRFAAADARFLTFGRAADGREQVQITHDALIAHWDTLRAWLSEDRDDLRLAARLEGAAKHWQTQGEAAGLLWRRPDLDMLRRYADQHARELPPLQARFYRTACRQERRERAVRGAAVAALLLLTLTALGAAGWAHRTQKVAENQRGIALEAIAERTYATVDKLMNLAGASQVLGEIIQSNLDLLDRLLAIDRHDGATQAHYIANLQRAADAWIRLNDQDGARETLERLLTFTRAYAEAQPDNDGAQRRLSVSYSKCGDLFLYLGDTTAARTAYQRALDITRRLAEGQPSDRERQRDLGIAYERLGDVAFAQDDLTGARGGYAQALGIRQTLAGDDNGDHALQGELAVSQIKLGDLSKAQGDISSAHTAYTAYTQAVTIARRLVAAEPGNSEWQRTLEAAQWGLSNLALSDGENAAALGAADQAVVIAERLADAEPANRQWQTDLAASLLLRGRARDAGGQVEPAIADYQRVIALAPDSAAALGRLGWALIRAGRFQEAREPTTAAHRLEPARCDWTLNLGHSHLLSGDATTARHYYEEALAGIADADTFERLPAADFKLFIEKGWESEASRAALAWMRRQFAEHRQAAHSADH